MADLTKMAPKKHNKENVYNRTLDGDSSPERTLYANPASSSGLEATAKAKPSRRTVVMASLGVENVFYDDMKKRDLPVAGWTMKELWDDIGNNAHNLKMDNEDHANAVTRRFMEEHP